MSLGHDDGFEKKISDPSKINTIPKGSKVIIL